MYRHQHQMRCQRLWEEAYGIPTEIAVEQDQGVVCLEMGKNTFVYPLEMEHKLRPFMGRRIGIIRTDLPDQEYVIRSLSEEREATQDTLAFNPIVSNSNTVACEVI